MSDPTMGLKYDVSPHALEEDVVFDRHLPLLPGFLAFGAMGAMFAFVLLVGLYCLFTDQWRLFGGVGALASGAVGAAIGAWRWFVFSKTTHIVNQHGIAVLRNGEVVQNCPWSQMTVVRVGRPWHGTYALADQHGRKFPSIMPESRHPDWLLALKAIHTRTRQLGLEQAGPNSPKMRARQVGAVLVVVGAIGGFGVALLGPHFRDLSVREGPQGLDFALALAGMCVSGVLTFCLWPGLVLLLERPLTSKLRSRSELGAFLSERQGKLEAVQMDEGKWYAYTARKELAESEPNVQAGIGFAFFGLLMAALAIWSTIDGNAKDIWIPWAIAVACLVPLVLMPKGLRLRKGLKRMFRRTHTGFEVMHPDGSVEPMAVVRAPQSKRSAKLSLGGMTWELQGQTRLAVDLRYLVPAQDDAPTKGR